MDLVPEWYASDNGFRSRAVMDEAHKPIVVAATAALSGTGGNVLDLGCGNGAVLKKIHQANPTAIPFGIDTNPGRIEHARELQPQFARNFVWRNIFESDLIWPEGRRYALVILMPGRLVEAGAERAAKLKERIRTQSDQVLAYAYDDWIARYGTLLNLAQEAGISLSGADASVTVSLASIL